MPESVAAAPWFDPHWHGGRVSPRAFAVLAPNPSWETFEGTNTWVLHEPGLPRCYVVDPGPDDAGHLFRVESAVADAGLQAAAILITHEHVDHVAGAGRLARTLRVPVLSRKGANLPDGALQLAGAPALQVVSLPGHSSDSVGFVFERDGSAVTGDVVFWKASTAIIWPDGNLKDYMDSLCTLESLVKKDGCQRFLAAHRRPVQDCLGVIEDYRRRRAMRLDMVREAVRETRCTDIDVLIPIAYRDVDHEYFPMCRFSIKAQLAYLQDTHDAVLGGLSLDLSK